MLEENTVVEASSQNVSCFFWPGERMNQGPMSANPNEVPEGT